MPALASKNSTKEGSNEALRPGDHHVLNRSNVHSPLRSRSLHRLPSWPAACCSQPWIHSIRAVLERHIAPAFQVVSQVGRRHSAFAERTLDAVAAFEGRVQACNRIGHGVADLGQAILTGPPNCGMYCTARSGRVRMTFKVAASAPDRRRASVKRT